MHLPRLSPFGTTGVTPASRRLRAPSAPRTLPHRLELTRASSQARTKRVTRYAAFRLTSLAAWRARFSAQRSGRSGSALAPLLSKFALFRENSVTALRIGWKSINGWPRWWLRRPVTRGTAGVMPFLPALPLPGQIAHVPCPWVPVQPVGNRVRFLRLVALEAAALILLARQTYLFKASPTILRETTFGVWK